MQKINDRFIGGIISGILANLVKEAIEWSAYGLGITKEVGSEKAAGFFLPKNEVKTTLGRAIGITADNGIAAFFGLVDVYLMTYTGKDYALAKGMSIGNASWSAAYGILSRMGASTKVSMDAKTTIVSWLAHTAFGVAKSYIVLKICDPKLFGRPDLSEVGNSEKEHVYEGNDRPSDLAPGLS